MIKLDFIKRRSPLGPLMHANYVASISDDLISRQACTGSVIAVNEGRNA